MDADMSDDTDVTQDLEEWLGEEGDPVVATFDVYNSASALGTHTQNFLFQFPLRHRDRPYEDVRQVRLKPHVKRVQWDIGLDSQSHNYNDLAEPTLRLETATLHGRPVDEEGSGFMIGIISDDKTAIHALPLHEAVPMRYSPAYLDKERESSRRAAADAVKEEDDFKLNEMPVTVQIKRRETEQQQEARLRSYAYLSQQEELDNWVELKYKGQGGRPDGAAIRKLVQSSRHSTGTFAQQEALSTVDVDTYVDAIAPGASTLETSLPLLDLTAVQSAGGSGGNVNYASATVAGGRAAANNAPSTSTAGGAAGAGAVGQHQTNLSQLGRPMDMLPSTSNYPLSTSHMPTTFPAEAAAVLPTVMGVLLKQHSVLNLQNIRGLLENYGGKPALSAAAASSNDASLHAAVVGDGSVLCIRKSYMLRKLNDGHVDPLRDLVLEMLQSKEQLKKNEIYEEAKLRELNMTDSLYSKVVKDLCQSRGSVWTLKPGV